MFNNKISALILLLLLCVSSTSFAADENPILRNWSHEGDYSDRDGDQSLHIKATYYSNEYIEALVSSEAEKNLWTNDEMENYKYTLLKNLNLAESIPFHIDMYVRGLPMYAGPFDRHITLMIGKNKYTPIDYDKRFNFKIQGPRDGMVFFPRYDPKTGKNILEGARDIRLVFDKSVSYALSERGDLVWIWDLTKDRGTINKGTAADRLEIDRLQKRTEKLNADREALLKQLNDINKEYNDVNSRIDELQGR